MTSITYAQGEDPILGSWSETQLNYDLVRSGIHTKIVGHIRQWRSFSAVTFHLDTSDQEMTNTVPLNITSVRTVFPSFEIEQIGESDRRGYFTYEGEMAGDDNKHAGHWNSTAKVINSGMLGGLQLFFLILLNKANVMC